MLRSIGTKPKHEDRSLRGRLLDCHGRIREMLDLAAKLGTGPRAPDDEIADGAARICRYFTQALPLHVRDEEESLLLRLTPLDNTGSVERMRAEHHDHEAPTAALVSVAERLAATPEHWTSLHEELARAAAALAETMLPHLEREEATIFPLLAQLDLDTTDRIVHEMQARRAAGKS